MPTLSMPRFGWTRTTTVCKMLANLIFPAPLSIFSMLTAIFSIRVQRTTTVSVFFSNLAPGTYSLQFLAPDGYTFTLPVSDNTFVSTTQAFTLSADNSDPTFSAGLIPYDPTTSITLTSSLPTSTFGQSVTFTASVTNGAGSPTGSVIFQEEDGTVLEVEQLNNNGSAIFSTASLPAGPNYIEAIYSGDDIFPGSNSNAMDQLISQATPTVAVSDAGGSFNGTAFAANGTVAGVVTGVDDTPASTLETVGLTYTYYAGSSASGTPLTAVPSDAGTFTVIANFAGTPITAPPAAIRPLLASPWPRQR